MAFDKTRRLRITRIYKFHYGHTKNLLFFMHVVLSIMYEEEITYVYSINFIRIKFKHYLAFDTYEVSKLSRYKLLNCIKLCNHTHKLNFNIIFRIYEEFYFCRVYLVFIYKVYRYNNVMQKLIMMFILIVYHLNI